ncbi:MAG: serine hydrolase [Candidatus Aminicenantales bacterium]|jgi:CubicO group peptidase (beta-lactamase class C family)
MIPRKPIALFALLIAAGAPAVAGQAASPAKAPAPAAIQKALEYSKANNGLSLLILQGGRLVFEDYHNGFAKDDTHLLASATKSFSGVLLAALVEDKIASSFDEKVSQTITEWSADPLRSQITLRELLNLTSGIEPGPLGRIVPYAQALQAKAVDPPGTVFQYGPVPYQIFGEVVKRKLGKETAIEYLNRRIFRPIGLEMPGWRYGQDGNPAMATGAALRASEWAKFGEFIRNRGRYAGQAVLRADLIEELLKPSAANPVFGAGFWLEASADIDSEESGRAIRNGAGRASAAKSAYRIIMSAGAGKQRLYVIEPLGLVVVRQGKPSSFSDAEFLSRLLQ